MSNQSPVSRRIRIVSAVFALTISTLLVDALSAQFQKVSAEAVIARQEAAAAKSLAGAASTRGARARVRG